MVRIAITGGIACGKSSVATWLAGRSVPVVEADEVGHEVMARGGDVHAGVVAAFGTAILRPDGEIDRGVLGRMVFADGAKRAQLNALTHATIMRRLRGWVEAAPPGTAAVAAVIPLLYEVGDESRWDVVVCVAAPETEQMRRLSGRGLSEDEGRARLAAQMPLVDKIERADYVIYNGGSRELMWEQTNRVWRHIRGE